MVDTSGWTRIGSSRGSNPAGVFIDEMGDKYYVKTLESTMLASNEWIAAQLYQLAGVPTLSYLQSTDPCQIITRWQTLDKTSISQFSAAESAEACRWFAVHAWTANWDAVGFHGDNQGVANHRVLTLDVGGALAFRACGDPKGSAFGTAVMEVDSLRTSHDNPHARALFGAMTPEQLITALEVVVTLDDNQITRTLMENGASHKLCNKMLARKADIERRLRALTYSC